MSASSLDVLLNRTSLWYSKPSALTNVEFKISISVLPLSCFLNKSFLSKISDAFEAAYLDFSFFICDSVKNDSIFASLIFIKILFLAPFT